MDRIAVLDPRSARYLEDFELLIRRGDEKARLVERLRELAAEPPERRLMIDAGAGLGAIVAALRSELARGVVVAPAPLMAEHLRAACPGLEISAVAGMESRSGSSRALKQ